MKYELYCTIALLSLVGLFSSSCSQKKSKEVKEMPTSSITSVEHFEIPDCVVMESNIETPIPLSTIVERIEFLVLQNSGRYVIDVIDKLLVNEERIFVLNNDPFILSFSRKGEFIEVFNPIHGAGWIDDFDILPDGDGIVVLLDNNRLIYLDNDLKPKQSIDLPFKALSGPLVVDDTTFLFIPVSMITGDELCSYGSFFRVCAYNPKTGVLTGMFPSSYPATFLKEKVRLFRSEQLLVVDCVVDSVYSVSSDGKKYSWCVKIKEKEELSPEKPAGPFESHHRLNRVMVNRNVLVAATMFPSGTKKPFPEQQGVNLTEMNITITSHVDLKSGEQSVFVENDISGQIPQIVIFSHYFPGGYIYSLGFDLISTAHRSSIPREIRGLKKDGNPVLAFYYLKPNY